MSLNIKKSWWETDDYNLETAVPLLFQEAAGPNGVALVKSYDNGSTQAGWGPADFMAKYVAGEFLTRRALYSYEKGRSNFAFVMRSMRLLCVDIDGKNGGLEFAASLGNLPYTLCETSKSGNGYHLFYLVEEDWSDTEGFASLSDQIGVVQGVDIRTVGCVYHWPQQRWNNRSIAPLPAWLRDRLLQRQQQRLAAAATITNTVNSQDPEELMLLQADLLEELYKPIPTGKRNTSLYAIGQKLKAAGIVDWQSRIEARAADIGLEDDEIVKLVRNISR